MDTPSLAHRHTWDLIPWVVNNSATATERERVDEHLRTCVDCRDEYAFQSRLQAGMSLELIPERDPGSAFKRLLERVDNDRADDDLDDDKASRATLGASNRVQHQHARRGSGWTRHQVRALGAVVIAQTVGLVMLGALLLGHGQPTDSNARYVTLSHADAATGAATIRFVPAPTLTMAAMQAILADAKVRIVESNQGNSIYGLAPDPGSQPVETADARAERAPKTTVAIARLRAQQGVLLAEPIVSPVVRPR